MNAVVVLGLVLMALPVALLGYAYFVYPMALKFLGFLRPRASSWHDPAEWPLISITIPAYNEEHSIRGTLDSLLALDYPAHRRQILIVSDASTDRTDQIVLEYADRGVELLRMPARGGKTAAENGAHSYLRGSIVVNSDATIRILPGSLKPLIRVFQDPSIGVASGRDLSVGDGDWEANRGESGYVGYEMWVRSLETRLGSIVGASGCFYAIRKELHATLFPAELSRDFASALIAREHGFRAVSVDDAICLVPRTTSLRTEFRRKVRTMARGLETLFFKAHLMNPYRYRGFALMLISHKLCRWLVSLSLPFALFGLCLVSFYSTFAAVVLALSALATGLGLAAMYWPEGRRVPAPLGVFGFALAANLAGLTAWIKALRGERNPIWEPTRRPA